VALFGSVDGATAKDGGRCRERRGGSPPPAARSAGTLRGAATRLLARPLARGTPPTRRPRPNRRHRLLTAAMPRRPPPLRPSSPSRPPKRATVPPPTAAARAETHARARRLRQPKSATARRHHPAPAEPPTASGRRATFSGRAGIGRMRARVAAEVQCHDRGCAGRAASGKALPPARAPSHAKHDRRRGRGRRRRPCCPTTSRRKGR